ncbi:MAG: cytochrome c, partial [Salinisphaeraceae bacterium]|nr:cytochrome c [Salinisphaeraceae bacterium]
MRVLVTGLGVAMLAATLWLFSPAWGEEELEVTPLATDAVTIEKGRYLARAGNCIACHTVPGEAEYSGGRSIETPFGEIISTNLTPDPETGLGNWNTADFWRALHLGRSKDGRRLYPAFPYTSYTRITREDADAMFAYFQSLEPVNKPHPGHALRFPYNMQQALMIWRALYFEPGQFEADNNRSKLWNRGAYLVEGLGHCKACHTPRNALGALQSASEYAGGPIPMQGWDALPLTYSKPLDDDEAKQLLRLLKTGVSRDAVTTGPMAEVVFHSLQYLEHDDLAAIVTYIRQLPYAEPPEPPAQYRVTDQQRKRLIKQGKQVYKQYCSDCHGEKGQGEAYKHPSLAGNSLVTAASTTNVIRSVLYGGFGPSTQGNPQP